MIRSWTYQRGDGGKTGRGETHVQSPRVPEVGRCEVFKINMIGMEAVMDINVVLIMAVMSIVIVMVVTMMICYNRVRHMKY